MAIVVTESDCDFLQKTYNPTGKVEMRVKSILVKLAKGLMEIDGNVVKEVEVGNKTLTKTKNKIFLGALASTEFAPAPIPEEGKDIELDPSFKYIPVLNEGYKIPQKYIPATVITDIYTVSKVNNWLEVFEDLANKQPDPEKGDLIVIASSDDPEMIGNYFLNVDLKDILEEIKNKKISHNDPKELIDRIFLNRVPGEELVVKLAEPLNHITAIQLNGKTYRSDSGIITDLPEVINSLTSDGIISVSKTLKEGLVEFDVSVAKATEQDLGVVKYAESLEDEREEALVVALSLLKEVKKELDEEISSIKGRLNILESIHEIILDGIQEGVDSYTKTIAYPENMDKNCDVKVFEMVENGKEEVFPAILKQEDSVLITMKNPEQGSFVVIFKR